MCVIMVVEDKRPTAEMVEKAFEWNNDGAGAAWREKNKANEDVVAWKKGIFDVDEMIKLAETLPTPYVLHFRIASKGPVCPELTHPFVVSKTSPLYLAGRTKGYLLFHNGDWGKWNDVVMEAVIKSNTPLPGPGGKWSDSRGMAFLCGIYSPAFMDLLADSQRGVLFSPTDLEIITGGGWKHLNGVWCSNDLFQYRTRGNKNSIRNSSAGIECKYHGCVRQDDLKDGFCPRHRDGKEVPVWGGHVKRPEEKKENTQALVVRDGVKGPGGDSTVVPFQVRAGQSISLELAETLHKQKKPGSKEPYISKNLIKKIRAAYKTLDIEGVTKNVLKAKVKAHRKLVKITQELTHKSSSHGHVH